MTTQEALGYAIFALNTFLYPDASSREDVARMDEHAEQAVLVLAALRDEWGT